MVVSPCLSFTITPIVVVVGYMHGQPRSVLCTTISCYIHSQLTTVANRISSPRPTVHMCCICTFALTDKLHSCWRWPWGMAVCNNRGDVMVTKPGGIKVFAETFDGTVHSRRSAGCQRRRGGQTHTPVRVDNPVLSFLSFYWSSTRIGPLFSHKDLWASRLPRYFVLLEF